MNNLLFISLYPEMETIARQVFLDLKHSVSIECDDEEGECDLRVLNVPSSSTSYVVNNME